MACSQSWPRPFARPGHEATRLSTPLTTQSRRACPACRGSLSKGTAENQSPPNELFRLCPSTSTNTKVGRHPQLCHPACPGVPWDWSGPAFFSTLSIHLHSCQGGRLPSTLSSRLPRRPVGLERTSFFSTLSIHLHSCQGGPLPSTLSSRLERTRISYLAVPPKAN
jgi:hypothetical protein